MKRVWGACLGMLMSAGANASGYRLPEVSVTGLGTGDALVANAEEPGAIAYNPAAMAFHGGSWASAGVVLIHAEQRVTPTGGNTVKSDNDAATPLPHLYTMAPLGERGRWGLQVNTPYGLKTKWQAGTFSTLTGALAALHPEESSMQLLHAAPVVAWCVHEQLAVSLGADYYRALDVTLNSQTVAVNGKGETWGWNASALARAGAWSVGAAYRSGVTVDLKGSLSSTPATAQLPLPWLVQVGVRYRIDEHWAAEFDWERTGWNRLQQIVIRNAESGAALSTATHNWRPADDYRFGLTYDLDKTHQLRFGYVRDLIGQGDDHFTAQIPDTKRHVFSVGYRLRQAAWDWELGYMYSRGDTRHYTAPVAYSAGADPNGTSAYNGVYRASAHLLGMSVAYKFP